MDITVNEFKKRFPNLAKDLEKNNIRIGRSSIRSKIKDDGFSNALSGYVPDVIDFLRRCNNAKEAGEIISFLENRGEISHEYAVNLLSQLREKGLRNFGLKKKYGYYFRQGKAYKV